ncbi:MAG: RNA polymerase sigma factor [Blautia wexlerae]
MKQMLKLPDRQREILELFYFSEMSMKQIAEIMKLTPQNVRVLAYRAKKQLLGVYGGEGI